ncbi:MAG: hypothetical protein J6S76_04975 [Clostridia bacterium]|nr:hypothetical protein [Clostridia bacterium]
MRNIISVLLIACFLFSAIGCVGIGGGEVLGTDDAVTTGRDFSTERIDQETKIDWDCTDDAGTETESGTDTEPVSDGEQEVLPVLIKITRPDLMICSGPGYDYPDVKLLDVGTYTIVEKTVCDDGFTWGKLKSGIGWINLDIAAAPAPHIPITMEQISYGEAEQLRTHWYVLDHVEDCMYLLFEAYEDITDIELTLMDLWDAGFRPGRVLYTLSAMDEEMPLVIGVVFYGDFTTYSLSFKDAAGNPHQYMIYTSGRNGSVILHETDVYDPSKEDSLYIPYEEYTALQHTFGADAVELYRELSWALIRGDVDGFSAKLGVAAGVYDGISDIKIGSYRLYCEYVTAKDNPEFVKPFPVLEIEVLESNAAYFSPGTHRILFEEGLYMRLWRLEEFALYENDAPAAPAYSDADAYVDAVGSDRSFDSILAEGGRQFGLCDFIADRLCTLSGGTEYVFTREEIWQYAETYLGVLGESLDFENLECTDDGRYTRIGRGGTWNVSATVSEEIRDGITVVTRQFYADYSRFVPSRKVEFHMEKINGEFKPVKTVVIEDSALDTAWIGE